MTEARLNPHPSGDPRYDVEVVGPAKYEGQVTVRYIHAPRVRWDVNDDVVEAWAVDPLPAGSEESA